MVNARQFDILSEMDISLWQRKVLIEHNSHESESTTTQADNTTSDQQTSTIAKVTIPTIELEHFFNHRFFQDILICLSLTSGDVSIESSEQGQYLNLGLINWQFTGAENKGKSMTSEPVSAISFEHNILKTPELIELAKKPKLKKALWQVLQTHIMN